MQKELNLKIKFEKVLDRSHHQFSEDVNEWFELDYDSPYMLLVSEVKKDKQISMSEKDKNLFGIDKLNVKRSEFQQLLMLIIRQEYKLFIKKPIQNITI